MAVRLRRIVLVPIFRIVLQSRRAELEARIDHALEQ